ncbi:CsbD family protein [Solimonas sp. K1W22B-7]|uniref:CsbD family protein n=1 Tax=Solimonas sp. K1W22B-7 TaxID=2303331 RepID=UPI000E334A61|nr:CsbD family protein [Solimonas sp. K1W22B-7]AXQ27364.1 CsbD family protein [Solimonas sp. K1W22B-7]
MNQDIIKSQWKQLKGEVKQKWARLTDDDLTLIEGKRDVLEGKIQERYGLARDKAEAEVRDFEQRLRKH